MKKLIALLLVASFGVALIGCSKASDDSSAAPASGIKDKTPKSDDEGG